MTRFGKGKNFNTQAKAVVLKNHPYYKKHGAVRSAKHDIYHLGRIGKWAKDNFQVKFLDDITLDMAHQYLADRAEVVSKKTLGQERRAFKVLVRRPSSKLYDHVIEKFTSQIKNNLSCRTYTKEQIDLLVTHQSPKHALSTLIGFHAGLRAHELLTIRKINEQPIDKRNWSVHKFLGRKNFSQYSVVGKGGQTREIRLPQNIAQQLETYRLDLPKQVKDRGVHYQSYYDIGGGNNWSASFSRASKAALGWSRGGHGERHSYAQLRMSELQGKGLTFEESLRAVSNELGHLRSGITLVYLR